MFVVVNSNLFRVFGTTPGSEEASTLEASRSPNRYILINIYSFWWNKISLSLLKSWLIICQGGPYKTCLLLVGEVSQVSLAAVLGEVNLMFYYYLASKSVLSSLLLCGSLPKPFMNLPYSGTDISGVDLNGGYSFQAKLLHLAWHPTADLIACAASNSLYMYYA